MSEFGKIYKAIDPARKPMPNWREKGLPPEEMQKRLRMARQLRRKQKGGQSFNPRQAFQNEWVARQKVKRGIKPPPQPAYPARIKPVLKPRFRPHMFGGNR